MNKPKDRQKIVQALDEVGVKSFLIFGLAKTEDCDFGELQGFWILETSLVEMTSFFTNVANIFKEYPHVARLLEAILQANDLSRRLAEVEAKIIKQEAKA